MFNYLDHLSCLFIPFYIFYGKPDFIDLKDRAQVLILLVSGKNKK